MSRSGQLRLHDHVEVGFGLTQRVGLLDLRVGEAGPPGNAPMTDDPIYLDHNGTTPVAPEVLASMMPYFSSEFGNASSATRLGRQAHDAVESAREKVARLIGARAREIIFTSGGTEASNHAIRGFAAVAPAGRRKIVTSVVEHPATEMPCRRLERDGWQIERLPVDRNGLVDADGATAAIDGSTALVTAIHAQNETGTLQPVAALASRAGAAGAPIHVDASQSLGKVAVDVRNPAIDALTIAGHKLYAPKGIGALYLRDGLDLPNLVDGAGQEGGRRPGTENVPYIVGLGTACEIARSNQASDARRMTDLRERLWERLRTRVPGLVRVSAGASTLPNTLNVLFPEAVGNDVLAAADGLYASTGSACHAGDSKPSSVILALGYPPDVAIGAVRLTLGRSTRADQIDRAADILAGAWAAAKR